MAVSCVQQYNVLLYLSFGPGVCLCVPGSNRTETKTFCVSEMTIHTLCEEAGFVSSREC